LEKGFRPVILERGKNVKERKYDIARLTREHLVHHDSNWCFGEGGAGTCSDGKLYTRANKRGKTDAIIQQLVYHGANPDILVDAHPHIGTDKLSGIIANIRKTITAHGGEYHFNTRVTRLIVKNHTVLGVEDMRGVRYEGIAVILATGHSARDIYELFYRNCWALEAKPFAIGVRAEHPQELINEIQYGSRRSRQNGIILPPATYALTAQVGRRGVFSFCMCPGGIMVPAVTAGGEIVINGMSNSLRNSPYANAGIVAQVDPAELSAYQKYGVLAGLRFQQDTEQNMYVTKYSPRANCADDVLKNNDVHAPAQRLTDFIKGKSPAVIPPTSYWPGVTPAPVHELLPPFISSSLAEAFIHFNRKMRGYLSDEAMVVAVESRTSSPVRIPRHSDTLQHVQLARLYPCGEGSGYAGGITSSAIDGVNCAEKIAMLNS
jgi:uncharacterized FAD-dependent dehydrogenase